VGGLSRCSLLKCLAYSLLVSLIVNELLMPRIGVCFYIYVVLDRLLLCTSVFYRSHTVVASLYFYVFRVRTVLSEGQRRIGFYCFKEGNCGRDKGKEAVGEE